MKDKQAKYPQLRFKGFTDAWVQRNLGEWADVRDGTHASPKYIEQGHPMVTSKNLTDSGLDMSDVSYLTDEDFNEINQRSKVDIGDILFGMIGTIGKPVIVDRDDFAIKNVALIKEKTSPEIINTWLIQYLKSPSFERFIQKENAGGTQKFIALGLIRDMKLMTPSVQEQARIGELLNHLDNLIAANQRKLDLLKEQKKGYLQKMFPKNGAKVPELRFAGFADAWEERKLGELFKPSRNKNNNDLYNQKDILAASLGTELIPKRTFFGLKSTKESVKNYRVVKHGDLIYTKSPIKGFPNGIVRTNKGNVGIVPSLYCVYQAQKEINTSIIQLYFEDKNRLDFYLFPLVNVGARNNVNITDLEFLEGIIKVPKSIEEQKKIVDFIEHFNKAITLHQRKLDLLKEQKKGFLQNMFV